MKELIIIICALALAFVFCGVCFAKQTPGGKLVDIARINPDIHVHLVYSTRDNFMKEDVYKDLTVCYLRKEAAVKLSRAQTYLGQIKKGYHLLVYDGLRPRIVQFRMWEVVKGTDNQRYVANPETGSIHNYGMAVDLTITDETGTPLDMGTPFDYFGALSQPRHEDKFLKQGKLSQTQVANRQLLRQVMTHAGFTGIRSEWWHFNAADIHTVRKRYKMISDLPGNDMNSKVPEKKE